MTTTDATSPGGRPQGCGRGPVGGTAADHRRNPQNPGQVRGGSSVLPPVAPPRPNPPPPPSRGGKGGARDSPSPLRGGGRGEGFFRSPAPGAFPCPSWPPA